MSEQSTEAGRATDTRAASGTNGAADAADAARSGNTDASMPGTAITVIGLGPMGRALAGAFIDGGHLTTVWNRTPGKADALVAQGARLAASTADAIDASDLIVVCVLNGDAARALLTPVAASLRGRTLVNLTTDTPAQAREMAAWAAAQGIDYLDGSIMTPIETIGQSSAVVLYSGPEALWTRHREALASLGGTASYLGADPGRAASYDVALLDLFWTSMAGITHAFALARAEGISAAELLPYARGIFTIGPPILEEFARHVDEQIYPGEASNLESAAAGLAHVIHATEARGLDASVLRAARAIAQRGLDAGYGRDAFSRLTAVLESERAAQPR